MADRQEITNHGPNESERDTNRKSWGSEETNPDQFSSKNPRLYHHAVPPFVIDYIHGDISDAELAREMNKISPRDRKELFASIRRNAMSLLRTS